MSATGRSGALVAFDLGGVLVRICRSWHEGCDAAGLPRTADPLAGDRAAFLRLVSLHQRGELSHDDFVASVASLAPGGLETAHAAAVHEAWILGEYRGVPELLRDIAGAGHETACLSNTNAPHWTQLERMPFFGHLGHRHASHLMRLEKPDPRIFVAFERAVGRQGAEIAYFDDLAENCAAARQAGWRVQQVDPLRETVPQMRAALAAWELVS